MSGITAKLVKELRERSGAGMMDCKKALKEVGGDIEEAMDKLKEKGIAKAEKKSGRVAADGTILADISGDAAIMLEINCETDFAAKSDNFKSISTEMLSYFKNRKVPFQKEIMVDITSDETLEKMVKEAIADIGENVRPRRFVKYETGKNVLIHSYIHMGGKVGVMLRVDTSSEEIKNSSELKDMADSVAMQIASMSPVSVDKNDFPADKLEKERKIIKKQVMEMGKPENIAEKITEGKVSKYIKENTLLNQEFVMDSDLSVGEFIEKTAKNLGGECSVIHFTRFELGEGVEKKEENFAEEVKKQMQ